MLLGSWSKLPLEHLFDIYLSFVLFANHSFQVLQSFGLKPYWIPHILNLHVIYLMTLGMLVNSCNFFSPIKMPWHLSNGHSGIIEYISPLLKYGPVAFIVKTWSLSFLFFHFFNMIKIELLINSYSFQTFLTSKKEIVCNFLEREPRL